MGYASWSVVFGEQPSAAKWNILGTNDASFNDGTGIANAAITSEHLNATIACRAYLNTTQTIESGTEKVLLDTEQFDLGSDFDTANSRFVAPLTGYYQVNICARMVDLNALGDQTLAFIFVNGGAWSGTNFYAATAGDDPRMSHSDLVFAPAGQFIELYVQNATGGTESLSAGATLTYMSIHFVGA